MAPPEETPETWYRSAEATELNDLFVAYDSEANPAAGEAAFAPSAPDWAADYVAQREALVRPALEAVAWKLEQRNYHPWIEPTEPPNSRDTRAGRDQAPHGLRLRFDVQVDGSPAPALLIVEPVVERRVVRLSCRIAGSIPPLITDQDLPLPELTEGRILETATRLLTRVFFGDRPVPHLADQAASPEPEDEAETEPASFPEDETSPDGDVVITPDDLSHDGALRQSTTARLPFLHYDRDQWEQDWSSEDESPTGGPERRDGYREA
jgi:hypothetical protein